MDKKILSICVPTFNRINYLKQSLPNLIYLANKYNLEICVSDNFSDDGTWQFIQNLSMKNERLVISRQTKNLGSTPNVVDVTRIASSYWILIVGDDDLIEEKHFSELLNKLKELKNNKEHKYVLINSYLTNHDLLLSLQHGSISAPKMKQIFNNSIEEFGFVGSHVFTNDLASVLQSTTLKELMGWPSLYLLAFYSLRKPIFFFSKPIVRQAFAEAALDWKPHHWLQLSIKRSQIFYNASKKANRSDIGKKIAIRQLFKLSFFKVVITSHVMFKTDTKKIINSNRFNKIISLRNNFQKNFIKLFINLLILIPPSIYFLISPSLRRKKIILNNSQDNIDGVARDVGIID